MFTAITRQKYFEGPPKKGEFDFIFFAISIQD
jgi:hypothetical protein